MQFDVVHSLLDCVPPELRRDLIANVLHAVAPGGRLLLSQYGTGVSAREIVEGLGYEIDGQTRQPTRNGRDRGSPSVWLRKPE